MKTFGANYLWRLRSYFDIAQILLGLSCIVFYFIARASGKGPTDVVQALGHPDVFSSFYSNGQFDKYFLLAISCLFFLSWILVRMLVLILGVDFVNTNYVVLYLLFEYQYSTAPLSVVFVQYGCLEIHVVIQ